MRFHAGFGDESAKIICLFPPPNTCYPTKIHILYTLYIYPLVLNNFYQTRKQSFTLWNILKEMIMKNKGKLTLEGESCFRFNLFYPP